MQNNLDDDEGQSGNPAIFLSLRQANYIMTINDFSSLGYKEQLQLINRMGQLKLTLTDQGKHFSLYSLKDFYIEVTRKAGEFSFDHLRVMSFDQLPINYKKAFLR